MAKRVKASVANAGLPHPSNDYLRYQVWLVIRAIGSAENKIVVLVIAAEYSATLVLLIPQELKCCQRDLRQPTRPRLSVFASERGLTISGFFQGPGASMFHRVGKRQNAFG